MVGQGQDVFRAFGMGRHQGLWVLHLQAHQGFQGKLLVHNAGARPQDQPAAGFLHEVAA